MDYREKYEQALENLKRIKKANRDNKELVDFIEYQYPELKESEDERIKRCIGMCLTDANEQRFEDFNTTLKDCLSWLEKQGEKNHSTDFSDLRTWKYIVDAVWTEKEGIGQYLDSPFTEETAKKLQKRFGNIEQKPTDNVEPKFKVGDIIRYKDSLAEYIIESISGGCYYGKGWRLSIDGDEDYELVGQIPVWSEEDEKMWSTISDLLWEGYKLSDKKVSWNKIRCWLLPKITYFKDRVQTHPKQEWNEKDEKLYTWCASAIQTRYNDGLFTMDEYRETSLWLKSLKQRMKGETK